MADYVYMYTITYKTGKINGEYDGEKWSGKEVFEEYNLKGEKR